jgi:fumarate hydratase, class II
MDCAHALHQAIACLAKAVRVFAERCVRGIEADAERCADLVGRSLMLVTVLSPHLGYDQAAAIAKEAYARGRTLREVVLERGLLDPETLDGGLDPRRMTSP